jgi:glucokinase
LFSKGLRYSCNKASQNYKSPTEIIRQFLNEATQRLGFSLNIDAACFGIAGAVANNASFLTNLKWSLNGEVLQSELGIPVVKLINDFVAVGYLRSCTILDKHVEEGV